MNKYSNKQPIFQSLFCSPLRFFYSVFVITLSVAFTSQLLMSGQASALTGSDFQAGNIIDNGVFFDGSTMSSLDVQNFLNAKVPSCDTNGSQMYDATQTRAQYGASQGYSAPYTCMKDYRQDTPAMPATNGLCTTFNAGNRSAAQIIHDVGVACGINPQTLLVLLQKEQSLVTDSWPFPNQYTSATGFGCPDTAPCDPSYGGFFYQVYYAARQFKNYSVHANQYGFFVNSNNNIGYNPLSSCGSSTVYLQNQATTDLYIYTPYQPNQAALNNLYGTGDACSAYGNRNFWRLFSDWFGSTHATPFAWQPISQDAYSDQALTTPVNTSVLSPSTTYYFRLRVQNMGNRVWHNSGGSANNQVNIGLTGSKPAVGTSGWITPDRPATVQESTVSPGDFGTFVFSLETPSNYANQKLSLNLVAEGQTWLVDKGLYWPVNTLPPTPQWMPITQEAFNDSSRTKPANLAVLAPNTTYYMRTKILNTGNTTWSNSGVNPVRLGTSNPQDRSSALYDASWPSPTRAATLQESSVAPGQTGTFEFRVLTPSSVGTRNEYFRPVVEGQTWMNDLGFYYPLTIAPPTHQWRLSQETTYTNSSQSTTFDVTNTANRSRFYVVIKAVNTGNTTWSNSGTNPVRLGTSSPQDRSSALYDSTWAGTARPATLQEASVAPGDTGTFAFWMQAPYAINGTTFKEYFRPVAEGQAWFNDIGMYLPVTMQSGQTLSWGVQSQEAFSNASLTTLINTTQLKTNTAYWLRLRIQNTSGTAWSNTNFNLGTSNPRDRVSAYAYNWPSANRAAKLTENSVSPGQTGTFTFTIKTPSQTASNNEYFLPVIDGVAWLPDIGLYWPITATP